MNILHVQSLFAHGIFSMEHAVGLRAPWNTVGNDGLQNATKSYTCRHLQPLSICVFEIFLNGI